MRKLGLFIAVMVVMLCIAVGACAGGLDLDGETFIPDETFRAYLLQFDTDGDHSLNDEEIDAVTCIDVTNLGVKTLGGLYNFTELEELYCSGNQLTALFTGDNRNLKVVSCEDNSLTSLSVTGNYNLEKLNCSGNELTSLDVSSAYPYLKSLECEDNKISELDISECHDLVKVIIKNKQKEYDTYYSWDGGESGCLSVDKTVSLITGIDKGIVLNDTIFPDETFRAYIERYCDNGDAILTPEEVDSVTSIYVNYEDIKSLKGIEFFTSLKELRCMDIDITSLDLRSNTNLEELNCYGCPIESLDLGQCTKLRLLNCSRTNISSLDVSKNTLLEKLTCWYLPITSIDLSQNANLQELDCLHNNLRELDLSHNPELTQLDCRENQLTKLDLSNNIKLKTVVCNDNQLTALDISKCRDLWGVYCYNNQLTELNTENNETIFSIWCNGNQLTTLNVSKNPKLAYFNCSENKITMLDISKCPALIKLIADETRFEDDKTYGWSRYIPEEYFAVDKNVRLIPVAVESVSLNYTKLDMSAGENKQLTGTISPFYAGNQNIRWDSDHPEIAIVDSNGKITAVTPGRATITVTTEDSGKTAACLVTVSPNAEGSVPVLGVTLNKTEMTLSEGAMETLVATVTPAYATNGKFIWSSNNNSVATVDAGGKVTAVAAGKATITAMSEDGTKTASCTVIVDSGDKVEAFVTRCYSIILGRKPDAAGFADWTTALRNKTKTASEIIYGFVGSNEFKNKNYSCSDVVEILYDEDGLNTIPQNAFSFFPNVQELRIEAGVSCADYSSITTLKNLEVLVLNNVCLSDIDFVKELTNLRRLALPHNHIDNGEPVSYLHKLEFLNLEDNDLSDITFVTELKNLKELIIQDNKEICDITPLSDLIKLEGLFISNTSITDISTLRFLKNLNALEMYGNKISDLKPLAELKDLEWLDARDNNIVDVSPLCELENLEFLYLSGNPISNLEVLKTLPLISIEDVLELPVF